MKQLLHDFTNWPNTLFLTTDCCIFRVDHVPWLKLEDDIVRICVLSSSEADASVSLIVMNGSSNQFLCLVGCAKMWGWETIRSSCQLYYLNLKRSRNICTWRNIINTALTFILNVDRYILVRVQLRTHLHFQLNSLHCRYICCPRT